MGFDVTRSHVYFMHDAPDNALNTILELEIHHLQTNVQTHKVLNSDNKLANEEVRFILPFTKDIFRKPTLGTSTQKIKSTFA
jgi:hypothetical protein